MCLCMFFPMYLSEIHTQETPDILQLLLNILSCLHAADCCCSEEPFASTPAPMKTFLQTLKNSSYLLCNTEHLKLPRQRRTLLL